jgi:nitrite reductase/ring-hydroxylating ferredoxin subunit
LLKPAMAAGEVDLALGYFPDLHSQGKIPSADRCPHRGARLSLDRVREGRLECPYHGWRFAAEGRCVAIPALPGFAPPTSHRVHAWSPRFDKAYKVSDRDGLYAYVAPSGTVSLRYDYRIGRRRETLTLGRYDATAPARVPRSLDVLEYGMGLSLAEARLLLTKAKRALEQGVPPSRAGWCMAHRLWKRKDPPKPACTPWNRPMIASRPCTRFGKLLPGNSSSQSGCNMRVIVSKSLAENAS